MFFEDDKKNETDMTVEGTVTERSVSSSADSAPLENQFDASLDKDQSPDTYSSVAIAANRRKFIIIGVVAIIVAALYFTLTSTKKAVNVENKTPKISQDQIDKTINSSQPVTKNSASDNSAQATIPELQLPELTQLKEPEPPAPPPPPEPTLPSTPMVGGSGGSGGIPSFSGSGGGAIFETRGSQQATEALIAKRGENIIVIGGGKSKSGDKEGEEGAATEDKPKDNSSFLGFGNGQLDGDAFGKTSSAQVKATKVGNLSNIIAQGKIISAVLETAINTDIPGMLRAIVVRDVYAESGKRVLIPKGSRVIGEYESQVKNGQVRVPIIWNRVILPNGFDIAISSPGTDRLGRAGIPGQLDNKFFTRLTSAFLVSFIIPYAAFKASGAGKGSTTSTTTTAGGTAGGTSTTTTSDPQAQLAADSAKKFGDIATEIVKSSFSEQPTIVVDQGEVVKIFVKQDLVFPSETYMNQQNFAR